MSGLKVLGGILTVAVTVLTIMAIYDAQPDVVLKFLKGLKWVGYGVVCLIAISAIIAAIGGNPGPLIFLTTLGGCIAVAVFIAVKVIPPTDRVTLAVTFSVATVLGLVIGGILVNAVAGDD